jgi:epoxyqueuosine reductase
MADHPQSLVVHQRRADVSIQTLLTQEILNHGDKFTMVPVSRLQDIKQDVTDLKARESLNNFQTYIVNDLYGLDVPETDFAICSILIVASPKPLLAKIAFTWQGQRIPLTLPASYMNEVSGPLKVEHYLNEFLNPRGYHVTYAPRLPRKLLAVRSGLGLYGRNNICYVEGMGSSPLLITYFSDIPCPEDKWHNICHMPACQKCTACLDNCPTGAITTDRFLIDNERCLTYFNESGGEYDFPDWIDAAAHHAIYGCIRCQIICPMNKKYLSNIIKPVEFTEAETLLLMAGKSFEHLPETLQQKVHAIDMENYLGALPRNLRVLFDQVVSVDHNFDSQGDFGSL